MKKLFVMIAVFAAAAAVSVNAADAKENFAKSCAGCHGKEGKGDTKLGQKMEARDYSDAKVQASLKDEDMFKAIKDGYKKGDKTIMKPYGEKLSDDEIKALVAHFRSFKK